MTRIAYATDNPAEFEDALAILSEVELARQPAPSVDLHGDLSDIARRRLRAAYAETRCPTFVIESELTSEFRARLEGGRIWIDSQAVTESQFCERFAGKKGVISQVLAYTSNGDDVFVIQKDLPGYVSPRPAGALGRGFDRVWVPFGYERTLAELRSYRRIVSKRQGLYIELANHLGLGIVNDIYEAHVTVRGGGEQLTRFRNACDRLGVKAIHIELPQGGTPDHLITGSIHQGPFPVVKKEVESLAHELAGAGFHVTRLKIEAMLRNSMVPVSNDDAISRSAASYFEFHVKIAVPREVDLDVLRADCARFGAHLSRNPSSDLGRGVWQRFATVRVHDKGRDGARAYFGEFLQVLRANGYRLSNILHEYTIYDTNASLDDGWFPEYRSPSDLETATL